MIAVRLEGRLGNQLFQYAFIYIAAEKLDTPYYIDQCIEPSRVDKYFKKPDVNKRRFNFSFFGLTEHKHVASHYLRRFYYKTLANLYPMALKELGYPPAQHNIAIQNSTIYYGYFQSAQLLKPFDTLIRNRFVLKNKFTNAFKNKYKSLYKDHTIVTVHIRRTDYLNLGHLNLGGNDLSLPIRYYQKAISNLQDRNIHIIFITDDQHFVAKHFGHIENKTITNDAEIIDFQHMLNADVCIISNSTFSWWGAWLNPKQNKTVYCPKYYLGYYLKEDYPKNIYPDDWKQIDY